MRLTIPTAGIPDRELVLAQLILEYASSLTESGGELTDSDYDPDRHTFTVVVTYPGGTQVKISGTWPS
jgi:hypothetical protein